MFGECVDGGAISLSLPSSVEYVLIYRPATTNTLYNRFLNSEHNTLHQSEARNVPVLVCAHCRVLGYM